MADLSTIVLPGGNTYNFKDSGAARTFHSHNYAGSPTAGGVANKAMSIPRGEVDLSSTSTSFTATVDGITELKHGACMFLQNGAVSSAAGFTININNLGAKPVYCGMDYDTAESTIFHYGGTLLLCFNAYRIAGGCWETTYMETQIPITTSEIDTILAS